MARVALRDLQVHLGGPKAHDMSSDLDFYSNTNL